MEEFIIITKLNFHLYINFKLFLSKFILKLLKWMLSTIFVKIIKRIKISNLNILLYFINQSVFLILLRKSFYIEINKK